MNFIEMGRLTDEQRNTLNELRTFLGKDAKNNIIVVFSKATPDQIKNKDKMQKDWNTSISSFIEQIDYRWSVSPNPHYFFYDRQINEERLMEIKGLITSIQEVYTTKQLEDNLKEQE